MKNKAITLSAATVLSLILSITGFGQEINASPYAIFGDTTPVCDISHQNKSSELITIIVLSDSTYATLKLSDSGLQIVNERGDTLIKQAVGFVGNAFFSTIDPKATEFSNVNPYLYCVGNPILLVDKDGQRPNEYEAAMMADVVYDICQGKLTSEDLPKDLVESGWSVSQIKTSTKKDNESWQESGLQAVLFERTVDGKTEYVFAFAGTDFHSLDDIYNDLMQIEGRSPQYYSAIKNAEILSNELEGYELTFVGHSMGGGKSAAASMATGRAAITFNPAAVSPLTKFFGGLGSPDKVVNYRAVSPDNNGSIFDGGCIVNNLQDAVGMPAPGKTVNVEINIHDSFEAHRMIHMVNHFRRLRK